ncbi:MAG TPA: hypothetical protein VMF14_08590 [Solirubrobacteraceae bacterium]|nr:hypothetical protein [Solirubrobacteraceae bacterium]
MPVDFEQPSWEAAKNPGRHVAPVGARAGAQELAANVYELDPGVVGSPLHVHHANEELPLVLAGTLSLRGPDGTQLLTAGVITTQTPTSVPALRAHGLLVSGYVASGIERGAMLVPGRPD